jgi:hypothetical protein
MSQFLRFPGSVKRDPAIEVWMREHCGDLGAIAQRAGSATACSSCGTASPGLLGGLHLAGSLVESCRPNMRMPRTRLSPSALRSPLKRHPLVSNSKLCRLIILFPIT